MSRRKTTAEYKLEIADLAVELVEGVEYVGSRTPITHRCKKCKHEWEIRPNNILNGNGCPKCGKKKQAKAQTKTTEQYRADISRLPIELVEGAEYTSSTTKTPHRCKKCKHEWEIRPNNVLTGYGCPKCGKKKQAKSRTKTTEQYKEEIADLAVELVEGAEYTYSRTKTPHRCKKCKHEWEVRPSSILKGNACPQCKESKGERKTRRFLKQHEIYFITQQSFKGCRNKNVLPFDFWIPKYRICIEYQGIQHFQTTGDGFFGGKAALKQRQKHDQIKRDFCKRSGIILVEIPYNDERIGQRIFSAIAQRRD